MNRNTLLLGISLVLIFCVHSALGEEKQIHDGGVKIRNQNTFVCDYCENTRELWFSIMIKRHWNVPLLYPKEQTMVFCYDMDQDNISFEFQINEMIFNIIADESGIFYTKDHGKFLDEIMCYYNKSTKKSSILKPDALIGRLIAAAGNTVFCQGAAAYGDSCIYKYNIDLATTEKIMNPQNNSSNADYYSDYTHIFLVNRNEHPEAVVYDIHQNTISRAIIPDKPIIAMGYGILITNTLELYKIGETEPRQDLNTVESESHEKIVCIEEDRIYLYYGNELFIYNRMIPSKSLLHFEIKDAGDLVVLCGNHFVYISRSDFSLHIINLSDMESTSVDLISCLRNP